MTTDNRTPKMALREAKYQIELLKKELTRIASNNDYVAQRVLESMTHEIAKVKELAKNY